ncbi:hypothetical protein, partial [Thiomonas sp.]
MAMAVVCALHPIPMRGALHHGNLFSVALAPLLRNTNTIPVIPAIKSARVVPSSLASPCFTTCLGVRP